MGEGVNLTCYGYARARFTLTPKLAKPTCAGGRRVQSHTQAYRVMASPVLRGCLATPPDPLPPGPALCRIGDLRRSWKVHPLMRSGVSRRSSEWSGDTSK